MSEHPPAPTPSAPMHHSARVMFEERLQLERLRATVMKEQADLRMERVCWERDRVKAERDELTVRVARLQAVLDRERRIRGQRYTTAFPVADNHQAQI